MLRLIDTSVSKSNAKTVDAARAAWCEFKASVNADTETVDEATLCFFVIWMYNQVKRKKPPFMRIEAPPSPADALIPRRFSPDTATKYLGAIVRYFHRRGIHLDTSSVWAGRYSSSSGRTANARQTLSPRANRYCPSPTASWHSCTQLFDFSRLAECCVYADLVAC